MKLASKLAVIVAGYGISLASGIVAVVVNEFLIPYDVQQSSGGMVAFGDMILFIFVSGVLSLAPTWFLLTLCVEKFPRTVIAAELLLAVLGPASWLAVKWLAANPTPQSLPGVFGAAIGQYVAVGAIPRMVLGPVLLVVEAVTFFMIRGPRARTLLIGAMVMDVIPLCLFALHMTAAIYH